MSRKRIKKERDVKIEKKNVSISWIANEYAETDINLVTIRKIQEENDIVILK